MVAHTYLHLVSLECIVFDGGHKDGLHLVVADLVGWLGGGDEDVVGAKGHRTVLVVVELSQGGQNVHHFFGNFDPSVRTH